MEKEEREVSGWPRGYQPNLARHETANLTHSHIPSSGNALVPFVPVKRDARPAFLFFFFFFFFFRFLCFHAAPDAVSFLTAAGRTNCRSFFLSARNFRRAEKEKREGKEGGGGAGGGEKEKEKRNTREG